MQKAVRIIMWSTITIVVIIGIASWLFLGGLYLSIRQLEQCGKQENEWQEFCEKKWYGLYAPRSSSDDSFGNQQITPTTTPHVRDTRTIPYIEESGLPDIERFSELFPDFDKWETYTGRNGDFSMRIPPEINFQHDETEYTPATLSLEDNETQEKLLIFVHRTTGTSDHVHEIMQYAYGLPKSFEAACGIASTKPGHTGFWVGGQRGFYIVQRESSGDECAILTEHDRIFALVADNKYLVEVTIPGDAVRSGHTTLDLDSLRLQTALQTLTFKK